MWKWISGIVSMQKDKYVLLDTDFISKMHIIQKDTENHLIDRIIEMPHYHFYCHSKIQQELSRHNISGAVEWLNDKVFAGQVICYSDEDILNRLESTYKNLAPIQYMNFLRDACKAFGDGYFEDKFKELQKIDYNNVLKDDFLEKLNEDCNNIGVSQNLGEIKTYVLLQMLYMITEERIYVFCSDDRNARAGILGIDKVNCRCISVLSAFLRLKKEHDFGLEDAKDYIQSWLEFCAQSNQITFRIQDNTKKKDYLRVPCAQVMREIYEDKLEEMLNGNLKYK